jgi:hypothetical protein
VTICQVFLMYFGFPLFASFHQCCILQHYTNFITRKIGQAGYLHKSVLFRILGDHWTERYCQFFFLSNLWSDETVFFLWCNKDTEWSNPVHLMLVKLLHGIFITIYIQINFVPSWRVGFRFFPNRAWCRSPCILKINSFVKLNILH